MNTIGRYQIQAEIGRGGFGRVFRALDPNLGRLVAIKLLNNAAHAESVVRFRSEAGLAGQLAHRNIVKVFDFGDENGRPYLVMEYLEGETLDRVIRSRKLGLLEKAMLIVQTAEGLKAAHVQGVIHRDVKPSNLMVLPDGTLKVMDFGVARLRDGSAHLTQTGAVVGTPRYMAPEQVMGETITEAVDVFALGIVCYELISGVFPFEAPDDRGTLYQITTTEPEFLGAVARDCSPALAQLIHRMLEKQPESRIGLSDFLLDVHPLLRELRRARARDLVASARSVGDDERAAELIRRALELDPENADARRVRSEMKAKPAVPGIPQSEPGRKIKWGPFRPDLSGSGPAAAPPVLVEADTQLFRIPSNGSKPAQSQSDLPPLPDLAGFVVAGRYRLGQRRYSSGQSAVYDAHDSNLNIPCSIKLLSPRLSSYSGYKEQFARDAAAAARLWHPYIRPVTDHGETDLGLAGGKALYIAMKYLGGPSLLERLQRGERFDPRVVSRWLNYLTNALDYLHRREVVHAGLRPTAIVFDLEDRPHITDFALSTNLGSGETKALRGVLDYLAPEQWAGQPPAPATDQYSLAVIGYLMLSGSLPFEHEENQPLRPQPIHRVAARNGNAALPPALSEVFERALEADPEKRYPGICEFAAAFNSALAGPARKPTGPELIFLSYGRSVSPALARYIERELDRRGYRVCLDSERQNGVGQFPPEIETAIRNCEVFLCLLGKDTLQSLWVNREIEVAADCRKPMVPILESGFQPPGAPGAAIQHLLSCGGVSLRGTESHDLDAAMQRLAESIQQIAR